jgi:CRISPR/Cas system-associated exonuclease Cas4 (RecB family)
LGDKENISASEISEYAFCNVSWQLDREGAPRSGHSSARMKAGVRSHRKVGRSYRSTGMYIYAISALLLATVAFILYYVMSLLI